MLAPAFLSGVLATAVAVQAPAGALRDRLLLRLLDEGFTLLPSARGAGVLLTAGEADERLFVQAAGSTVVKQEVEAEPRAVAELELLQRAVLVLERAGTRVDTSTIPVVRLYSASAPQAHAELALAVFALGLGQTRTGTQAEISLCAEDEAPDRVRLTAARGGRGCRTPLDHSLARSELDRAHLDPILAEALAPEPEVMPWVHEEPPFYLSLTAGGGALARAPSADPIFSAGVGVGKAWLGARLDLAFIPASRGALSAFDLWVQAGPSARADVGPFWRAAAAARLGLLLHHYALSADDAGTHLDLSGDLITSLQRILVAGGPWLSLDLSAGLASRSRRHLSGDNELWARSAFRLGVGLSLSYDLLF